MAIGPDISLDISGPDFGADPLFAGLKIAVAPGEVLALIGPSGVGKTTALRIIGGLERGYTGHAMVGGGRADLAAPPGFVFQDARLLPWADASANLRTVRADLSAARIDDLLAQVGLQGHGQTFPRQMSGGMQRRLGFARALAVNPGLLLLDEPFASLDAGLVAEMQQVCRALFTAQKPTVVLVSHDPDDALALADRVIVLRGRPARIAADIRLNGQDARKDMAYKALIRREINKALAGE